MPQSGFHEITLPKIIPVDIIKSPLLSSEFPAADGNIASGHKSSIVRPQTSTIPPLVPSPLEEKGQSLPPKYLSVGKKEGFSEQIPNTTTQQESLIRKEEGHFVPAPNLKTEESTNTTNSTVKEKPLILIPPNERLAELSKEYENEIPTNKEEGKKLSLGNSNNIRYISYLDGLKSRIYYKWKYPDVAAREGQAGMLHIDFTIRNDGILENIALVKSSGYPMLDDAALSAVRLAAPFYPFPKGFGSLENITINASFEYILGDYISVRR